MVALHHVLVATDFGEAADVALRYGRELARTFGADLHVLHVVEDVASRALVMAAGTPEEIALAQTGMEEDASRRLDGLLTDDERRELRATTAIEIATTPAATIVAYARRIDAGLIVIGTHGRGPVTHLLLGNVAERVVRTAPCPVLTVRHPEHDFVVPDPAAPAAEEA
ncbi:MAG: universal stress protein [Acidobacteria bacterium]|nr:universal stress protein [Acidobacteriota bacterium]